MPLYQFTCQSCSDDMKNHKIKKDELFDGNQGFNTDTDEFLFVIESKMKDKPVKPTCPRCHLNKSVCQSYTGYEIMSWVRGNGLVNDIGGARRDMNRFKLINEDPYGHMRQPGEKDHLDNKFRRAGMNMQKIRKESIKKSKDLIKRARSSSYNLTESQIEIIKTIGEDGCDYNQFSKIDDINKLLSSLMPDYICKVKDKFILMALGCMLFEEFTS